MPKNEKPLLARNITYLRNKQNMTLVQACKRAGIKFHAWCAYEEGRSAPRLSKMPDICDALEFYDVIAMVTKDLAQPVRKRKPSHQDAIRGLNEVKQFLQTIKENF